VLRRGPGRGARPAGPSGGAGAAWGPGPGGGLARMQATQIIWKRNNTRRGCVEGSCFAQEGGNTINCQNRVREYNPNTHPQNESKTNLIMHPTHGLCILPYLDVGGAASPPLFSASTTWASTTHPGVPSTPPPSVLVQWGCLGKRWGFILREGG